MKYIWQLADFPEFKYDSSELMLYEGITATNLQAKKPSQTNETVFFYCCVMRECFICTYLFLRYVSLYQIFRSEGP